MRARTAPRPPGTFKIGSIAGSDVLVRRPGSSSPASSPSSWRPAIEQVAPGLGAWKYVAGFAFAVILYLSVLLHEASHALMARRLGFPVGAITLHFLGGMTAIEGEARKPSPGVPDRGGRSVDLAGRRCRCAGPLVRHPRRPSPGRGRGSCRRQPAGRPAQPRPGPATRRRPGAQVAGLARLRQRPPGHDRRRLGRAGDSRGGDAVAGRAVAGHRGGPDDPRLPARVRGRRLPLVGSHRGHVGGPAAQPVAAPGRPPARAPYPRRAG